ncbi:MAG TPA: endopeptidase La [Ignavibacteriales bacterium]|nr:endopeptidase La [Ignavibacteriales bacterium]
MKKVKNTQLPEILPVLPLVDKVLFPGMVLPVLVGREQSLEAVMMAMNNNKMLFVVAQKENKTEKLNPDDIFSFGTIATIVSMVRLPNGLLKILLEGLYPAHIQSVTNTNDYLECTFKVIDYRDDKNDKDLEILFKQLERLFTEYVRANDNIPNELLDTYENLESFQQKVFFVVANINEKNKTKQQLLEAPNLKEQILIAINLLETELQVLKVHKEIENKVREKLVSNQKKAIIQEQIRILKQELGDEVDEIEDTDIQKFKEMAKKAKLPKNIYEKFNEEIKKLAKTHPFSPEYSVTRNYIEWLEKVPWTKKTKDNLDISVVKKILDEDHYGLEKPKERILEYISVLNLVKSLRGQILCLVGPPGVGKTSLAKSIARALNRNFVRISLGGVRDEAEIRGHRRTYVGALPGKIIQAMKKAGSINPVILLDEIDKMTSDFRGDPASAMLEVLDPEQNKAFNDHYLEVDYDLSNVFFITTANVMYNIPAPLLDRMEVIELPGYLSNEKIHIALNHIIPKQKELNGLKDIKIIWQKSSLNYLIDNYTREAGVRNLERTIASLMRKIAKDIVENKMKIDDKLTITLTEKKITSYLGVPKYTKDFAYTEPKIGVANGLAWTSTGGDVMVVEATAMKGSEKLILTGKLGDVMKESATTAFSFIKANADYFGINPETYEKKDIHIHFPEGAIPKDGPSAGITIATVLVSILANKKVNPDFAMTGEITLQGNILPIGGLNEKLLAAKRLKINNVIIPAENEKDLTEIKQDIKAGLNIIFVKNYFEAYKYLFINE